MKKIIPIFVFVFTFMSCVTFRNQRHFITYDSNLIDKTHIEKSTQSPVGYWVGNTYYHSYSVFNQSVINKIILIPQELENNMLIKKTIEFINLKKPYLLDKLLANNQNDSDIVFCTGLKELFHNNFNKAGVLFKKQTNPKLKFISEVLVLDCLYEIHKKNGVKIQKSFYYDKFQSIIDNNNLTTN